MSYLQLRAPRSRLGPWLLGLSVVAILSVTLRASEDILPSSQLCLICGDRGLADAILNTFLFLPLGIALGLIFRPALTLALVPLLLSFSVELAQVFIPGRDGSLGDIVFNSLGGAVGILVLRVAESAAGISRGPAARVSIATGLGSVAVVVLTALLLRPSLPSSGYYSLWVPELGHLASVRGTLVEVTLDGIGLPEGRVSNSETVRARLLSGKPLVVRGFAGPPVDRLGGFFALYDDRQREISLLGPDRNDLVFRIRLRAADFRLDRPDLRFEDALRSISNGDPFRAAVWRDGKGYCIRLTYDAVPAPSEAADGSSANARPSTRCELGYTVGRGWALLLYPESPSAPLHRLLDSIWVALLVLPLGYWTRLRWESAIGASLVLGALIWLPAWSALLPTPPLLLIAALAGWGTGVGLQTLFRRG